MKLVEIITSERTDGRVLETIEKVMIEIGKDPVFSKAFPGFVSTRILMPLIREAIFTTVTDFTQYSQTNSILDRGLYIVVSASSLTMYPM